MSCLQTPANSEMQEKNKILDKIVEPNGTLDKKEILNLILPPKVEPYTWTEIDDSLHALNEEVESLLKQNNDNFDKYLDEKVQEQLKNLCSDLNKTQFDVIRLQYNINEAKQQFDTVRAICTSKLVQDRRELLNEEERLEHLLKQSKFNAIIEFFNQFLEHLHLGVESWKKIFAFNAANYIQFFDWSHYHQIIYLLRACGKTTIDLDKFERLYQSGASFTGFELKQPIDKMDLNNFIEFPTTYSLESQLDIVTNAPNHQRIDFSQFSMNPDIVSIINSSNSIPYELFRANMERLRSITVECCRLLIDLNLNYIESHFTDGINIDKLNNCDATSDNQADQQVLPLYAFSPQEYITQIGQHLLTLRKQTEQFDQIDNRPLKLALEYLQLAQNVQLDVRLCSSVTEIILKSIAKHCIRSLIGRTTNSILSRLTPNARRQLATDAMYLDNVLEDLNLLDPSETNVEKFKSLFKQ